VARGKVSVTFGGEEWTFDREQQFKKKLEVLLKTASSCFNERGYSGTSLRDLAARLKVTDGALYYYVRSKEELVFLCYARTLDLAERAFNRAANEGKTGLEKLQLCIKYQVEAMCGPEGPFAVMNELPLLRLAHRAQILERMNKDNNMIASFFQIGFQDGSIRKCNPVIASSAILGALAWIAKWYKPDGGHDVAETAQTFVDVLTRGVAAP
jgi:AcrR family transcriptional regulator